MSLLESKRKFLLYFQETDPYFEKSKGGFEEYPIEFEKFIDDSTLYNLVDDNLIPIKPNTDGNYYLISLIISYGLAHLQRYLRTNDNLSLKKINNVAFFLISHADYVANDMAILRNSDKSLKEFFGMASSMDNGMAISLLIRMYKINKDIELFDFCIKLLNAFNIPEAEGGFTVYNEDNTLWFNEFPLSKRKVLNGKIFALMGLIDFKIITQRNEANELLDKGTEGLINQLPLFDRKWWSNYYIGKNKYIASAKYHSLHVLQLTILFELLKLNELLYYKNKFMNYDNKTNRIRSGFVLLYFKIINSFK